MCLEVEEEEELLSFHACKIQCRKALATDTPSSQQTNKTTSVESVHFPEAFSLARVRRKGGFIYRCCFQNKPSIVILSVNTSLGIRHLSIYLETGDKDCLTWEWMLDKFVHSFLLPRSTCAVQNESESAVISPCCFQQNTRIFILTYKSWSSLFTLTSKHKRPECSGFSAFFLDVSPRLNLVGFGSELWELFGCSL